MKNNKYSTLGFMGKQICYEVINPKKDKWTYNDVAELLNKLTEENLQFRELFYNIVQKCDMEINGEDDVLSITCIVNDKMYREISKSLNKGGYDESGVYIY